MLIFEGGLVTINDSQFTNMANNERGSVINANYRNSKTEIYNSEFMNNTSVHGGVANVQDGSMIKFYD